MKIKLPTCVSVQNVVHSNCPITNGVLIISRSVIDLLQKYNFIPPLSDQLRHTVETENQEQETC
jgi:hypothetical protein